uniref:Uncharacterized protein n=1 Tax=Noctiluca scintillans TaxID=2966 RepID=A0A7S1AN39_NOCSC
MVTDSVMVSREPWRASRGEADRLPTQVQRTPLCTVDTQGMTVGAANLQCISTLHELVSGVPFFGKSEEVAKDLVIYVLDLSWHTWAMRTSRKANQKLPSAPRKDLEIAEQMRLINTVAPLCDVARPRLSSTSSSGSSVVESNSVVCGKLLVVGGEARSALELPSDVQDFCHAYTLKAIMVESWAKVAACMEAVLAEMVAASIEQEQQDREDLLRAAFSNRRTLSILSLASIGGRSASRRKKSSNSTGSLKSDETTASTEVPLIRSMTSTSSLRSDSSEVGLYRLVSSRAEVLLGTDTLGTVRRRSSLLSRDVSKKSVRSACSVSSSKAEEIPPSSPVNNLAATSVSDAPGFPECRSKAKRRPSLLAWTRRLRGNKCAKVSPRSRLYCCRSALNLTCETLGTPPSSGTLMASLEFEAPETPTSQITTKSLSTLERPISLTDSLGPLSFTFLPSAAQLKTCVGTVLGARLLAKTGPSIC